MTSLGSTPDSFQGWQWWLQHPYRSGRSGL